MLSNKLTAPPRLPAAAPPFPAPHGPGARAVAASVAVNGDDAVTATSAAALRAQSHRAQAQVMNGLQRHSGDGAPNPRKRKRAARESAPPLSRPYPEPPNTPELFGACAQRTERKKDGAKAQYTNDALADLRQSIEGEQTNSPEALLLFFGEHPAPFQSVTQLLEHTAATAERHLEGLTDADIPRQVRAQFIATSIYDRLRQVVALDANGQPEPQRNQQGEPHLDKDGQPVLRHVGESEDCSTTRNTERYARDSLERGHINHIAVNYAAHRCQLTPQQTQSLEKLMATQRINPWILELRKVSLQQGPRGVALVYRAFDQAWVQRCSNGANPKKQKDKRQQDSLPRQLRAAMVDILILCDAGAVEALARTAHRKPWFAVTCRGLETQAISRLSSDNRGRRTPTEIQQALAFLQSGKYKDIQKNWRPKHQESPPPQHKKWLKQLHVASTRASSAAAPN
jgi:hypothetical protein